LTHPWSYTKGDQHIEIAVDGSLIVNDIEVLLHSVLEGSGVGHPSNHSIRMRHQSLGRNN
jgi:hypothetical protein